ncbi:MAG: Holliday junction resolvase RuvX [Candidatus Paceibacterota bacterium]|jgi:putative Holliday junction resolvase
MRLLGIDYGTKRVGVALSDESGFFAMPFCVLKNSSNLAKEIEKIFKDKKTAKIIIGHSVDFRGKENLDIASGAKMLAGRLIKGLGPVVEFENETLTTAEAQRLQGNIEKIDASAAALILKSYIDKGKNR